MAGDSHDVSELASPRSSGLEGEQGEHDAKPLHVVMNVVWEFLKRGRWSLKGEQWKPYCSETAAIVESSWQAWQSSASPPAPSTSDVTIAGSVDKIDFSKMEQIVSRTKTVYRLRRRVETSEIRTGGTTAPTAEDAELTGLRAQVKQLQEVAERERKQAAELSALKRQAAQFQSAAVRELEHVVELDDLKDQLQKAAKREKEHVKALRVLRSQVNGRLDWQDPSAQGARIRVPSADSLQEELRALKARLWTAAERERADVEELAALRAQVQQLRGAHWDHEPTPEPRSFHHPTQRPLSPHLSTAPLPEGTTELYSLEDQLGQLVCAVKSERELVTELTALRAGAESREHSQTVELELLKEQFAILEEQLRKAEAGRRRSSDRVEQLQGRADELATLKERLEQLEGTADREREQAREIATLKTQKLRLEQRQGMAESECEQVGEEKLKLRAEAAEARAQKLEKDIDISHRANVAQIFEVANLQSKVASLEAELGHAQDLVERAGDAQNREAHLEELLRGEKSRTAHLEALLGNVSGRLNDEEKCVDRERARADSEMKQVGSLASELRIYQEAHDQLLAKLSAQEQEAIPDECEVELECWRLQDLTGRHTLYPRRHLIPVVQAALRKLVPDSHTCECLRMRNAVVTEVVRVANMNLWRRYSFKRQTMANELQARRSCPYATSICPDLIKLQAAMPHVVLDGGVNEALLLHGTQSADDIARQGFDARLNRRALYGMGVYLTIDSCKAMQYCDATNGVIVIARAALGHPYIAVRDRSQERRPPDVEGLNGVLHDSIIARPGIPNGQGGRGKGKGKAKAGIQTHWEFVVPDEQVYPEFIVHFHF